MIAIATFFRFNPDISYIPWVWMLLPVPVMFLAQKHITRPRIYHVKFSKDQIKKDRRYVIVLLIICAILFLIAFFLIAYAKEWIENSPYPLLIVAVVLFLIWSSIGYLREFKRLYLYALLMASSVALTGTNVVNNPLGLFAWSLTSVIMIATGLVLFVKFLKKYPKP